MKKNRLKRELLRWGMLLAFPALMSSCLMEYPEMTADGELGGRPYIRDRKSEDSD